MSFGAWPSDPPLDRLAPPPPGPPRNVHALTPNIATIKAGGTVNFIVAGLYQIVVYGPGTEPGDIRATLTEKIPGAPDPPAAPLIINDPANRIFRGLVQWPPVNDRVEPHFSDRMWGWVRVLKQK